jgi:integrase
MMTTSSNMAGRRMKRSKRSIGGRLFKRCRCGRREWPDCPHSYWFEFTPAGKPQHRERLGVAAFDEAVKRSDELRVELRATAAPADLRLTVDDAASRYETWRKENGRSHEPYVRVLRDVEIPGPKGATVRLGAKALADVTTDDIEAAVVSYRSKCRKRQAAGVVGERKLLQTGRALFNWAIKKKLVDRSPFYVGGRPVVEIKPAPGRDRRLEEGEEERLLEAADRLGARWTRDALIAILDTGLRGGTIRLLQWADVRGDRIVVPPHKQKRGHKTLIKPIWSERLREVIDRRRVGPDGEPYADDAFVFGKSDGSEMPRRQAHELFAAVRKEAGIASSIEDRAGGLTFHDLRAEHGSELLESGVDLKKVSEALGHTTITMTQAYLRSRVGSEAAAYERLEAARAAKVVDIKAGKRRAS